MGKKLGLGIMITLVEGLGVGAGKSYYVLSRIVKQVAMGGTVFLSDTMEIFPDKIAKLVEDRWGVVIEPDQLRVVPAGEVTRIHEVTQPGTDECPVLIVLDESQDELNARDFADKRKRPLFAWCCQSRHDSNDLIFLSQHRANVDKQIRRLVTYTVRVRNMLTFKIAGMGVPPPFNRMFWIATFDGDSNNAIGVERVWHDKQLFGCYRSKSMAGKHKRAGIAIPRKALQKKKAKSPMLKYLLIVFVGCLAYGGYRVYEGFGVFGLFGAPAVPASRTVSSTNTRTAPDAAAPASAYDLREEALRATDESSYLITDSHQFAVDAMSPLGFVEAVKGFVVRIRQPNGRLLFVVGTDGGPVRPSGLQGGAGLSGTVPTPVATVAVRNAFNGALGHAR